MHYQICRKRQYKIALFLDSVTAVEGLLHGDEGGGQSPHVVDVSHRSELDPSVDGPGSLNVLVVPKLLQLLRIHLGQVLHKDVLARTGGLLGIRGVRHVLPLQPHHRIPHVAVGEPDEADGGEGPPLLVHDGLADKPALLQEVVHDRHRIYVTFCFSSSQNRLDQLVVGFPHNCLLLPTLQLSLGDGEAHDPNARAPGLLVDVVELLPDEADVLGDQV